MKKIKFGYTAKHAKSFKTVKLPSIDVWENQYPNNDYTIKIIHPESHPYVQKQDFPILEQ